MEGIYLIETCKSQNTTMLNAFDDCFDAGEVFGRRDK
jgi:hypothetical protein